MATLFSSRASVEIYGRGAACRANWPLGSIAFDAESFTFGALLRSYRLRVQDIDHIKFGGLSAQFIHHASDVPSLVRIWGLRLPGRLKDAIQQHHLEVQTKP